MKCNAAICTCARAADRAALPRLVGERGAPLSKSSSTSETFSLRGDSSSSTSADDSLVTAETKRVGSDDYGYISIPKNWVKFTDLGGGDSIQYTDGSGYNIVSMNAYTKEKANIGEGEDFTAETIANRIYYNWSENKEAEKFWGAKTTVSGNDAYQVQKIPAPYFTRRKCGRDDTSGSDSGAEVRPFLDTT